MSKKKNNSPSSKKRSAHGSHQRPAQKRGDHERRHDRPRGAERAIPQSTGNSFFLHGRNSVEAALKNPKRECLRLIGTEKALKDTEAQARHRKVSVETVDDIAAIAATVPEGSPHQGILLEVRPLPSQSIEDLQPSTDDKNIILMLDQVTDPHNVGACMRSAAAFGAKALITQDKNSPNESGIIARTAAGALESLPWLRVTNLSQALDTLRDMGYWHVGLDGHTDQSIRSLSMGNNIVIVMGSEGKGLRPLVRKNCDAIVKIPMTGSVESLNVSNAAAIALYELAQ